MKKAFAIASFLILTCSLYAQQRNVLVELFTNSHCPLCPPAHAVLDNYRETSPNIEHVNFIFYHMAYPYSDDPLYQANKNDSGARNLFYGPFGSTPDGFFDGKLQSHTYSEWSSKIDNEVRIASPVNITLNGSKGSGDFTVNADVTPVGSVSATDLVVHFVVVENVSYKGRNGVSPQYYVMRKMLPDAGGIPLSQSSGTQSYSQNISLNSGWIPDSISVVAFIQSKSTKEVYQSARIAYSSLSITGIEKDNTSPDSYTLYQNYPNPFNPSTVIRYNLQKTGYVSLKVYNVLGNLTATLVDGIQNAGVHQVIFNTQQTTNLPTGQAGHQQLASGIYLYRLRAGDFTSVKKMVLLK